MELIKTIEEQLISIVSGKVGIGVFVLSMYAIIVVFVVRTAPFRRSVQKIMSLFLYEDKTQRDEYILEKTYNIENKLKQFEKEFSDKVLKDKTSIINNEIDKYIETNLKSALESNLSNPETIKNTVVETLNETIKVEFNKYIKNIDLAFIQNEKIKQNKFIRMEESSNLLERAIEQESRSSATLKTVMINLFVLFNIGILIAYIIWGSSIDQHTIYAITGLYLSLATFIFYIFRTSHFRTAVLLAIREDNKKHFDVIEYLNQRQEKGINEHDVDVLRMLLINRSEREQKADHPYEVILKGVSGSNIQFKGGKMQLAKQKE